MAKIKDLRKMGNEDLQKNLKDLRMEIIKTSSHASGAAPKNPGIIKKNKKTIARILTILNEKKTEERKKDE